MTAFGITAALCLAAPTGESAPPSDTAGRRPLVVLCDGPVEMTRTDSGGATLVLSGGVRLKRADLSASARRGVLRFGADGGTPEEVSVEGDVVVDSPRFSAEADSARFVPAPGGFTVTLERRRRRAIDLRAGALRVACGGPVVYSAPPGRLAVSGRLRAETPDFVVRADSGLVALGRPGPPQAGAALPADGGPAKDAPGIKADFSVKRIELDGSVEMVTKPGAPGPTRKVRARRAVFVAAKDLLVLSGDPGPEIESDGVVLTAPEEIHLYVKDNRIESPKGPMRAVIGPRRPEDAAHPAEARATGGADR